MKPLVSASQPLVEVSELRVAFADDIEVVKGVSFQLDRGECLALVGESGSGKSVTSRSLVGLAGQGAQITAQQLRFAGEDLLSLRSARDWRQLRGARIGFVMQDALGSLDPLRPVGQEIDEALRLHTQLNRQEREERVIELLRAVGVNQPQLRARQYPHQLSGGLRQRALIATAIACESQLLIADEPTTALDAAVQAQLMDLLDSLRSPERAMLVVSHDMAVVARLADRVAVMHNGRIIEQGPVEQVLYDPQQAYTKSLLRAAAAVHVRRNAGTASPAAADDSRASVLEARGLSKAFVGPDGVKRTAVKPISFSLKAGETLGIVGESGSGKTTLMRMLLALETPDQGQLFVRGQDWQHLNAREQRHERRRIQVVFQDPLSSFDPRYTVQRVLDEALRVAGLATATQRHERTIELLNLVQLQRSVLARRPIELSGGQRQRIAIARALAAEPEVLVCDEPVSALDVSVQAQILQLLVQLKQRLGLACLFVSHDLGVVQQISDRVLVMKDGEVVERGTVSEVFTRPQHAYSQSLLAAIPFLYIHQDRGVRLNAIAN
ncbi:dipeptide ABC transporter ATP-binding protein [Pseudomonas sp. 5P_3.1_Bac2]|uniref:dipeptide ABC transporter ATP-binding protein n=1 Tax=Pseudomonas sp. 5P_3.1_Bac2 TaxID=2971617 RepID=UPI0021C70BE1|nr:ABC transporter ATP-binding protein [Pseudomonas sp. 5P_3.1_Bac2]MCU1717228.1 ABC transporter ATP-binding protein [Pseudomonas sp. 5P_3.1_Bac2]